MKKRNPKKTDPENSEKAYKLLTDLVKSHPDIDNNIWVGVCCTAIVDSFFESGFSYEKFCSEMDNVNKFYKNKWERGKC